MNDSMDDVTVLIPAYNEVGTIRDVVARALEQAPRVVVIDDGSRDGTVAELAGLPITLLQNARNLGKAAGLWKGIAQAQAWGARHIVTLDGDGQHRPEDIPRLVAAARRHPGRIIIGARLHDRGNFPARRYYANRLARFSISWAAGYAIADSQSGFRVYPASLFDRLMRSDVSWSGFVFESEILIAAAQAGFLSVAVDIPGIYPVTARTSHYRPLHDTLRIAAMIMSRLIQRGFNPAGLWRSLTQPGEIDAGAPARPESIPATTAPASTQRSPVLPAAGLQMRESKARQQR